MSNENVFDKTPAQIGPPAQPVNAGTKSGTPEKKGLTGKHVALILGVLVIIAAAVVIVFLLRPEPAEVALAETDPPAAARVMTEENYKEIMSDLTERIDRGRFRTYMNTTWTFPDGKSPSSNAVMGNSPANNYPFWFTVAIVDTGEIVFSSGILPVGAEMAEIKLEKELPAGEYAANIRINLVDEDDEPVQSNVGFNITLRILA